jgi:hypothetical protein
MDASVRFLKLKGECDDSSVMAVVGREKDSFIQVRENRLTFALVRLPRWLLPKWKKDC